jgi:hypothetical protein
MKEVTIGWVCNLNGGVRNTPIFFFYKFCVRDNLKIFVLTVIYTVLHINVFYYLYYVSNMSFITNNFKYIKLSQN